MPREYKYSKEAISVKKLVAFILISFLVMSQTSSVSAVDIGKSMKRAMELYVPIACTGPDYGFKYLIGTGFPVTADLVMTAGHVECMHGNITEISHDRGTTWEGASRQYGDKHRMGY